MGGYSFRTIRTYKSKTDRDSTSNYVSEHFNTLYPKKAIILEQSNVLFRIKHFKVIILLIWCQCLRGSKENPSHRAYYNAIVVNKSKCLCTISAWLDKIHEKSIKNIKTPVTSIHRETMSHIWKVSFKSLFQVSCDRKEFLFSL